MSDIINSQMGLELTRWMKKNVRHIVIIPHVNPDGDAIGSTIGLNEVLREAGFNSQVIVPNEYPAYLQCYGDLSTPLIYESAPEQCQSLIEQADLIFYLDFNDSKRMGKLAPLLLPKQTPTVMIDHHPDPQLKVNFMFSNTSVSSTAELVYHFIEAGELLDHLKQEGAQALLTGIVADTGSFSHNASTAEMYRVVGDLIERGANKVAIQEKLFNNFSSHRMRLLGYCLSEKMEIFPEYHAALIWLTKEELNRYNYVPGDTEGFVNYPLSIEGIRFSAFFMEKDQLVKISFRSKGRFSTQEFSRTHFHGGGHRNASGGETNMAIEEAIHFFRKLLPSYAGQLAEE